MRYLPYLLLRHGPPPSLLLFFFHSYRLPILQLGIVIRDAEYRQICFGRHIYHVRILIKRAYPKIMQVLGREAFIYDALSVTNTCRLNPLPLRLKLFPLQDKFHPLRFLLSFQFLLDRGADRRRQCYGPEKNPFDDNTPISYKVFKRVVYPLGEHLPLRRIERLRFMGYSHASGGGAILRNEDHLLITCPDSLIYLNRFIRIETIKDRDVQRYVQSFFGRDYHGLFVFLGPYRKYDYARKRVDEIYAAL